MIDIIGALNDVVLDWNIDSKCNLCWEFTAPLRESDLNEYQQKSDDCCVLVAVTDYRVQPIENTNVSTGLIESKSEVHSFNLFFLAKDDLGLNVYNEIDSHSLGDSKWFTILKPIGECVAITPINFCEYLDYDLQVLNWSASTVIDWLDMNYTGWKVNVQLRANNL